MRGLKKRKGLVEKNAFLRIFLLIAISIVSIQLFQSSVQADQLSWTSESPTYSDSGSSIPTSELDAKNCINQQVFVSPDTQSTQICVFQKDNFRYGYYQKFHNPGMWNAYTENKLVVGIGSDSKMYKVENLPYSPMPLDLSVEGDLYYRHGCAGCPWGGDFYIYKDFIRNLNRDFNLTTGTTYTYDDSKIKILRYPDNNQPLRVNRVDASDNGQWLVLEIIGRGIIRLDRQTMDMKQISGYTGRYGVGLDPRMEMAISDDGSHVVIAGHNTQFIAYDVNDQCGSEVNSEMSSEMSNACPSKQLNSVVDQQYPNGYFSIHKPAFDSEGGELTFYIKEQQASQSVKRARVIAFGYNPDQLDYLALGDSYSSGEGDLGKKEDGHTYYLPRTNDLGGNGMPQETCHISSRSYPFFLRDNYSIELDKMQSIACSGAITKDVRYTNKYLGQADRLKILGVAERLRWQADALGEFVPGRIEQIRFVKKYKPKALTLTIGGNDVDFGAKVRICAETSDTCKYVSNLESRAKLGYEIKNQFNNLINLYKEIHKASPNTKIYVLGYPSFINPDEMRSCGFDDGHLKPDEKELIDESVKYMNMVIENASKAAGVNFIDIRESLSGGRICDVGGEYVTGLQDINFEEARYGLTFHPNAQGHQKIAEKVEDFFGDSSPIDYGTIDPDVSVDQPPAPDYFSLSMQLHQSADKSKYTKITTEEQTKTQAFDISLDEVTFDPNSSVKASIHSTPTDLGEVAANPDGSLDMTLTIPESVSAGSHTIVLSGTSYSGEPVELYQTILVRGSNPDDIDDDGILDNQDSCMFIEPINQDTDGDAIDDMCDPEISETNPYRVRNGDSQKNENSDYFYIERNVAATSITGISGDHDPDSDGWAIVAQSTKSKNSGVPANFWVDDNKSPHVSIRTSDRGCVQFTPRSLKVVGSNKLRKLKQEVKNTNTCRSEASDVDSDGDGTPDNQQTLYRARNGIASNNEDPSSIYLERNSVAAEAQLGISDHSYSNAWNMISSSQNDATKAKFVKLVMVTNQEIPTVLAAQTKTNNKGKVTTTCIALQPHNTNTITTNNQDRKLKKITLPEGEGCE